MTVKPHDLHDLREMLRHMLARELRLPSHSIETDKPLTQYGLDSIAALTIAGDLEEALSMELPSALLWDCPTIDALARHLCGMLQGRVPAAA
jgi:acyl carrier protein